MIRILHILGSVERAGVETFVMNLYRRIDKNKIQFDFAIYNDPSKESYADEIKVLGGRIYILPKKNEGIIKNLKCIEELVRANAYDIVWRSAPNCLGGMDLLAARLGGASECIMHAHSSSSMGAEGVIHYIIKPFINVFFTKRVACGYRAGKWMFGNRKFLVMNNGIDTRSFNIDESISIRYKKELGIKNESIIGSVAGFRKEKNVEYIIDIFNDYLKKYGKSKLLLVGDGVERENIEKKIEEYGIGDNVLLLGVRADIKELMSIMDVFVLTSFFEGFPVTMIEAQAAGLPCVVSESVSNETNIYGNVEFVSLSEGTDRWTQVIHNSIGRKKTNGALLLKDAGFDIEDNIKTVEEWFCK